MPDIANKDRDHQTTSEDLVARVAEGDEFSFRILVNRHQASILNLTYRFMGDRVKAEDLAQETFLQVWRAAKNYQRKSKFTTWLYRICTNLCLNEIQSLRRKRWLLFSQNAPESHSVESEILLDESPNPEDLLLARERSRQIADALQTLPENQRIALILRRYDDLSYEEISRVLDCSVSAVESLLVRAKRTLQQNLKKT
jgi:RNA polymerase sigma-70 factor (ECF subfamily)